MRNTHTRILKTMTWLMGATMLLSPLHALSVGVVSVDDTIAGLGTDAVLLGFSSFKGQLLVDSPRGRIFRQAVSIDERTEEIVHFPGEMLTQAGTYRMELMEGSLQRGEAQFTVSPDRVDLVKSTVRADRLTITPDGQDTVAVTVTLVDQYSNPLSGRPMELISNRNGDDIQSDSTETDTHGSIRFAVRTTQPGLLNLRALDVLGQEFLQTMTAINGWNSSMMMYPDYAPPVSPYRASVVPSSYAQEPYGIIAGFEITIDPSELNVDEVASMEIRAIDRNGFTVEDYEGIVRITTPNDPKSSLPGFGDGFGETTFTPKNRGMKNLPLVLSFRSTGAQRVVVEDRANPSRIITGETTVTVAGRGSVADDRTIEITSHTQDQTISETQIRIEGKGPPYVNLLVTGGTEDAPGETDGTGVFSIPVTLNSSQRDFTLRVRDDSGKYDSGSLHLVLDQGLPEIESITFSPNRPEQQTNVLAVVKTEPKLSSVTMILGTNEVPLFEQPGIPGIYQAIFQAPDAGSYQPSVKARDSAGNTADVRTTFFVTPKALPVVAGVSAKARPNGIEIRWSQLNSDEVKAYRVYIAEGSTEDFGNAIDTEMPTDSMTVAGLKAGVLYSFAVTAIAGNRESKEKSTIVQARPLGVNLVITPNDAALQLSWEFDDATLDQLSSFLLEYGVEPEYLTEQRILDPKMKTVTLRDLLPGIPYYLRIIPISITGERLMDLATTGHSTPIGTGGFTPDPTVEDPEIDPDKFPPPPYHEGAQEITESGFSSIVWGALAATTVTFLLFWKHHRHRRELRAFQALMERQYHRHL